MKFSNCPVCLVGIVKPVGYVELKEGPLEFKLGQLPPTKKAAITIVGIGAAPESPTLAKSLLRDLILSLEKRIQ